ncbi:uncharacterized protein PFLUO_LOCUS8988 [Penicillium psychrofluorescens]|uniref:uncharacterized protein n=1 Tax=Penicillium psychrofluorescens TaxID=3158075 RepID=UPI003CCCAF5B
MEPGGGPAPLRKACQNCTIAKRRCIVKLPRCARCSAKSLDCSYDLEPLPSESRERQPPMWKRTRAGSEGPVHCLLQRLSSQGDNPPPAIVRMHEDREGIEYVVWILSIIPNLVVTNVPSVFIHPKRRLSLGENPLVTAVDNLRRKPNLGPSNESFQHLLRIDPTNGPLDDALTAVQALMLYMVAFMFSGDTATQNATKPYFCRLSNWIDTLEMRAHDITTQGLTPWQGWLFGESTRRTILAAHIFICVFNRHQYELSDKKVWMEALPFDGRFGLWLAETPQAWIASAGEKRGQDVQTKLVSWHEFSTNRPVIPMGPDGDMFMSMMLVSHNGKTEL